MTWANNILIKFPWDRKGVKKELPDLCGLIYQTCAFA
jgi:hypothetical protein